MCSLHYIHTWGAVGSHSTASGDQLQILSQYLGQGFWLKIDVLTVGGKLEHSEKTPHRKVLPLTRIKPRTFLLWRNSANHYTTVPPTPPCRPAFKVLYKILSSENTLVLYFRFPFRCLKAKMLQIHWYNQVRAVILCSLVWHFKDTVLTPLNKLLKEKLSTKRILLSKVSHIPQKAGFTYLNETAIFLFHLRSSANECERPNFKVKQSPSFPAMTDGTEYWCDLSQPERASLSYGIPTNVKNRAVFTLHMWKL